MTTPRTNAGVDLRDWVQRLGNGSVSYDGLSRVEERVKAVEDESYELGRAEALALTSNEQQEEKERFAEAIRQGDEATITSMIRSANRRLEKPAE